MTVSATALPSLDPVAEPPRAGVEGDDDEDQHAEEDLLVGVAVVLADEDCGQDDQHHRSEHGPGVVAAAAEPGPAEDHGGERLPQVGVVDALVAGAGEA